MTIISGCLKQVHTRDFAEQASLLHGWNQHYAQLSSGAFSGSISELLFDDIHLFKESTSRVLFQSGNLAANVVAIGIPLATEGHGLFCGNAMHSASAHIFSGSDGFEFLSPPGLMMGGIAVSRGALIERLPEASQESVIANISHAHLKCVRPQKIHAVREFMHDVFDLCRESPALLQDTRFRQRLREITLTHVAEVLADVPAAEDEDRLTPRRRWKIVMQARDYLSGMADTPVSVETLCMHLGVSRRTLQYCFQELLGMNPAAFLRAQRLNGVHQLLKEAHSVTEAATAWGFWHFGHFSQEYKKLFGELPSDTWRRQHQRHSRSNR